MPSPEPHLCVCPASAIFLLSPPLSTLLQDAATLRYLLVLLLAYPLGFLSNFIPTRTLKYVYHLCLGLWLAQFVFGITWTVLLVAPVCVYIFHALTIKLPFLHKSRHLITFWAVMLWMTVCHLHRLHTDYMGWSLDASGPLMLQTMKLTSFAFSLYDGLQSTRNWYSKQQQGLQGKLQGAKDALEGLQRTAAASSNGKPTAEQQKAIQQQERVVQDLERKAKNTSHLHKTFSDKKVEGLPNPLAFFSFCFSFITLFAGPAFDYSEWVEGIAQSRLPQKNAGAASASKTSKDGRWGLRLQTALKKLLLGLLFLGLTAVGQSKFPFSSVYSPAQLVEGGNGWAGFWKRLAWANFCIFFVRFKYYFAWLVSEGGAVMAGFG